MNKTLIIALCFSSFLVGSNPSIQAQTEEPRTPDSKIALGELKGPVRRVRIETAQILVKNGSLVEGPRALRGIATYDQKGVKIDSVNYAVDDVTQRGKHQYSYDDKGNVVEVVLFGDDGSVLSKMIYQYEHDELGNWKKKTSAIAVYENGVLRYEPLEVSYRTITYYYAQTIVKLAPTASKVNAVDAFTPTATSSPRAPALTTASLENPSLTKPGIIAGTDARAKPLDSKVRIPESKDSSAVAGKIPEDESAMKAEVGLPLKTGAPMVAANNEISSSREPAVKHVSEKVLRDAAIDLPMPEYPPESPGERFPRKVEVEVLVNEKGEVGSALAISGNSQLHHAAERAARNARFWPTKLSPDPIKVFGVISYDFTVRDSNSSVPASSTASEVSSHKPVAENPIIKSDENPSTGTSSTPSEVSSLKPLAENPIVKSNENPSTGTSTVPSPVVSDAANPTSSSAPVATDPLSETGLEHLTAGRHAEAVTSLKQSIKANPNDALAYLRLGMAHSALNQSAEAVDAINTAIRMKREVVDAAGYFHLGHSYVSLNLPWDAIDALRQALYIMRAESVDPAKTNTAIKFEDVYYSLGVAYHNAGRYNDAIKQLKEAVKFNPKLAEANYGLGLAYLAKNDTKSAQGRLALLRSLDSELAKKLEGAIDMTTHNSRTFPNRTNRVF